MVTRKRSPGKLERFSIFGHTDDFPGRENGGVKRINDKGEGLGFEENIWKPHGHASVSAEHGALAHPPSQCTLHTWLSRGKSAIMYEGVTSHEETSAAHAEH